MKPIVNMSTLTLPQALQVIRQLHTLKIIDDSIARPASKLIVKVKHDKTHWSTGDNAALSAWDELICSFEQKLLDKDDVLSATDLLQWLETQKK